MQAIAAGHICLDIIPNLAGENFLERIQPGHLLQVGAAEITTGGSVSNTGLALHKLGIPTQLMGKVGDDMFGRAVCDLISTYGAHLASGMIVARDSETSYSIILSPPGVDRIFLHNPGANNTFASTDLDYVKIAHADIFHFGYPPLMRCMYVNDGEELAEIFRRVKTGGTITSLDMAFPDPSSTAGKVDWRTIFAKTLPFVDIFMPSIEELIYCLDQSLYYKLSDRSGCLLACITPELLHEVSSELLNMGASIVALKLGDRGLYLRTAANLPVLRQGFQAVSWAGRELWAPCFQVKVIGTTGSGDATIAGFISGLLKGFDPYQTMTLAAAVGASNVEASDALSGIHGWNETLARIAMGWERCDLGISAKEWSYLPSHNIWVGPGDSGDHW